MTESDELKSIVQALVAKTASGKLSWRISRKDNPVTLEGSFSGIDLLKAVSKDDVYFVSLGSGFVVVAMKTPAYDPDYLSLLFFNKEGNKAAEYKVEAGEPLWDDLKEMINNIHKKLFGFKSLVNELVG